MAFWRQGKNRNDEIDAEIRSHLDMAAQDRVERGQALQQADQAARKEFGNVGLVTEVTRDVWGRRWIEDLAHDLRFGWRTLRRSPGFAITAILTLALGIGPNTAIFTVINAVLLRPLPYAEPERIAKVGLHSEDPVPSDVNVPQFVYLREHGGNVFEDVAAYSGAGTLQLKQGDGSDWLKALAVTDEFFPALGANLAIGREISSDETRPGSAPAVVLSDAIWRRAFGGDSGAIGKQVTLNADAYTVVGVLPPNFDFIEQPSDIFTPLRLGHSIGDTGTNTRVIARLKPGVSLKQARTRLSGLYEQLPDKNVAPLGLSVMSYQQALAGDLRPSLLILFGAVAVLLLIACANVASLILTRANGRARETAIRLAIGAGRGRLLRQSLAESFLIALMGAAGGLLAAAWALHGLAAAIPWGLSGRANSLRIDQQVLFFTLGTAVFTSLIFGLASFWQTTRTSVIVALKEGRPSAQGPSHGRIRNVLAIAEVALSLTLLIGASLLGETLHNLYRERLGFDPHNVIRMTTPYPMNNPSNARIWSFEQQVLAGVQRIPGVLSAAAVTVSPLAGQSNLPTQVAGNDDARHSYGGTEIRAISSRYFETLRTPVLEGRPILEGDTAGASLVAVINQRLARRWWPGKSPIGEHIVIGEFLGRQIFKEPQPPREVVGVVADTKGLVLGAPAPPMVYVPAAQEGLQMNDSTDWVIRTAPNAEVAPAIREVIAQIDPGQRITALEPLSNVIHNAVSGQTFDATLLGLFAAVALALASMGIYGVLSLHVAQRTHEIGIRMALGAEPRQVLGLVVKQGLVLALAGVAIGSASALGLTQFLRGLLYGVQATSFEAYVSGAAVLIFVALLASYIPARRAVRVDPLVALRHE